MKKSILAIAVAAAALPLAAQAATPDFYGRLGVALNYVNVDDNDSNTANDAAWFMDNTKDSWVGIRGEVPLYNQDLQLIYQLEKGVTLTDSSSDLVTRNSFVGLGSDSLGSLFFGRYDSVVKDAEGRVDQFDYTAADMANTGIFGQNRYSNTINYQSADMGGLSFAVQTVLGENQTVDDQGNPNRGLADGYGVSVSFTQDTIWANLAYEVDATQVTSAVTTPIPVPPFVKVTFVEQDRSIIRAAAGIDVGNLHGALLVQQVDQDGTNVDAQTQFVVSGAMDATEQLTLKAQYTQAPQDLSKDPDELSAITLGADYELGQNITSYALISRQQLDESTPGANDEDTNLFSVGLVYNF